MQLHGNIATLNPDPPIRRVMPTVIAKEIVGVQPMTGPVGQIHTLRVRYAETTNDASAANVDTTAGEEALSPFKVAEAYSGSLSTAKADATPGLEGSGGRKLSIQILKANCRSPVSYKQDGHSKLLRMHNHSMVLMLKQKLWLL